MSVDREDDRRRLRTGRANGADHCRLVVRVHLDEMA